MRRDLTAREWGMAGVLLVVLLGAWTYTGADYYRNDVVVLGLAAALKLVLRALRGPDRQARV